VAPKKPEEKPSKKQKSAEFGKDDKADLAHHYKEEGNEAYKKKDYLKAVNLYTSGIKLDPENHVLFSNRAAAHLANGDHKKALEDANQAVKLNSTWPKAYIRKAQALSKLGKHSSATNAYEDALLYDKDNQLLKKELQKEKMLAAEELAKAIREDQEGKKQEEEERIHQRQVQQEQQDQREDQERKKSEENEQPAENVSNPFDPEPVPSPAQGTQGEEKPADPVRTENNQVEEMEIEQTPSAEASQPVDKRTDEIAPQREEVLEKTTETPTEQEKEKTHPSMEEERQEERQEESTSSREEQQQSPDPLPATKEEKEEEKEDEKEQEESTQSNEPSSNRMEVEGEQSQEESESLSSSKGMRREEIEAQSKISSEKTDMEIDPKHLQGKAVTAGEGRQ